ncbi:prepilin-type N-terminal cleavage/methylation domain-containing protein [Photobacterium minamisatsumaniensis]
MKNLNGFTLIEVVIVIVLLGVLSALTTSLFIGISFNGC